MKILVLGGGIAGLTTAHTVLERGYNAVTLMAAAWPPDIVSSVAAAVWYPYKVDHPDVSAWGRASFARFAEFAATEPASGVRMVRGVEYRNADDTQAPAWASAVEEFQILRGEAVPPPFQSAFSFRVPIIETPRYLAWLRQRVEKGGANFIERHVDSLAEIADEYEAIFNCTGLGARALVGDETLYPIRGQIVKLAAGGDDGFHLVQEEHESTNSTYIIPRSDGVICGGTAEPNVWATDIDEAISTGILARAVALRPELAARPVLETRVGLRPARPTVRLEVERLRDCVLCHNYGHGGAGVTLSWGCAAAIVDQFEDAIG
ncbi:MAG: FAD-dependent oxidoreductase [Anaerolineales bacterium]|nr:FAD-dependent oxidoreductase [Anaerolineales bacterium]MCB9127307.1 FAD-dependent oxidoreductase [Ardenticatenales bacterium]MCB9172596.1 FAD-dependent oxidoreductase [Ardenticatenales bacterium]